MAMMLSLAMGGMIFAMGAQETITSTAKRVIEFLELKKPLDEEHMFGYYFIAQMSDVSFGGSYDGTKS